MKNFKTFYENTIVNNIDLNAYNLNNDIDLFDKVQNAYNIFKSEYIHNNNKHLNETYLFKEWLQGLPSILTVPFYNSDILKNGLNFAIETNDKLLRKKVRNENLTLANFDAWSGAVETKERILNEGKGNDFDFLIEDLYPDGLTETQLNDILWFEEEWLFESLDIENEEENED